MQVKTCFCFTCGAMLSLCDIQPSGEIDCDLCLASNPASKLIQGKDIEMSTKFNHRKEWLEDSTQIKISQKKRAIIEDDCPKCESNKMYYWYAQIRSVDEGQTVFHECVNCGYIFSIQT
ncbi:unnamed protein product [Moneuplotes crassus]|uniref:DNA-directed RNA polymerase subunit n=1 Tax=Euplotes crassus TaxID=5936 RepID=A0AAD1Y737_EUPCR|nr:unnamed protein product [Moneuplotes crassus]